MRLVICLLLLVLPATLPAAIVPQQLWTTDHLLQGFIFGQAPEDEMICVKGPCIEPLLPEATPHKRTIISSFRRPVDVTHLAGIPITAPRYDFHDGTLFRVSFNLLCNDADSPACIAAVAEALRHSLVLEPDHNCSSAWGDAHQLEQIGYVSPSGINVHLTRRMQDSDWQTPFVEIYDRDLMNQVRQAANPNYQLP